VRQNTRRIGFSKGYWRNEQASGRFRFAIFESADFPPRNACFAQVSGPSQRLDDIDLCFADNRLCILRARRLHQHPHRRCHFSSVQYS
jgi:hypothetical protein